jgi:hypothetical protein
MGKAPSICRDCRGTGFSDRILAALTGEDIPGLPTSQNTEPGLAFSDTGEP